jgi:hypothetical protein
MRKATNKFIFEVLTELLHPHTIVITAMYFVLFAAFASRLRLNWYWGWVIVAPLIGLWTYSGAKSCAMCNGPAIPYAIGDIIQILFVCFAVWIIYTI